MGKTFVYTNLFFAKSTIADTSYNISITSYTKIDGCIVSSDLKVVTVVTPSKLNTDPSLFSLINTKHSVVFVEQFDALLVQQDQKYLNNIKNFQNFLTKLLNKNKK